jgi:SAM-dependent methyltransferase
MRALPQNFSESNIAGLRAGVNKEVEMNNSNMLNMQLFIDHWHSKGKISDDSIFRNKTFWDGRADYWDRKVTKGDTDLEIINRIVDFLLDHELLFKGAEVIDIGCGPGKFVTRFAETADHVTALDISENMLLRAKENVKKAGHENVSFVCAPFQDIVLEEMGWKKKFDLVFASLCPAVASYESMQTISTMSKSYCFNRTYSYRRTDLLDNMHQAVLNRERDTSHNLNSIICTYAVLYLMGYYPSVVYMDTNTCYKHDLTDESAWEYAMLLDRSKEPDAETLKKVQAYLESVTIDGVFLENVYTKSALFWWDVNIK